jgi:elongation factor P
MAIQVEGQPYKLISAEYHPGQGKMGGVTHARLQNLATGTSWETSFRAELKFEELPLERKPMDFLYRDEGTCYFMEPVSGEQAEVPAALLGDRAEFLTPEMRLSVEFLADQPVSVVFPGQLEIRVADTAPAIHGQGDNTWKDAKLENGVHTMVPQFIQNGDVIRIDLASLKYMDRAKRFSS